VEVALAVATKESCHRSPAVWSRWKTATRSCGSVGVKEGRRDHSEAAVEVRVGVVEEAAPVVEVEVGSHRTLDSALVVMSAAAALDQQMDSYDDCRSVIRSLPSPTLVDCRCSECECCSVLFVPERPAEVAVGLHMGRSDP
jgi:hypothetical protein